MASKILIVADDLTGAADCGIACAVHGLDTVVTLEHTSDCPGADVLAVDANTRRMPPNLAAMETARIVRANEGTPAQVLFKKIDSTLRGNVGVEVAAALQARRCTDPDAIIVMSPAFPALGRTTVGGHQRLHGTALEQAETWQHEGMGGDSNLPRLLEEAGLKSALISLDCIRDGITRLTALMQDFTESNDAIVCDAETDEDLRAIASAGASLGGSTVWAGSAGLARHLPEAMGLPRGPRSVVVPTPLNGSILFVVGSPSKVSREQAEDLATEADVVMVTDARDQRLSDALMSGRDVILRFSDVQEARLLAPHASLVGGAVLTGGETARAVLQAFGVGGFRLMNEIEPGVPLAMTLGSRPLPVITKAGGFGDRNTLVRCRAALRDA
jgi:D-threonate/D-erythronate kinase